MSVWGDASRRRVTALSSLSKPSPSGRPGGDDVEA
jgi:hypothetical protein